MGSSNGNNNNAQSQQTSTKKAESEENILDFLGVSAEKQSQQKVTKQAPKMTVFDPLQDENDSIFTQPQPQKKEPPILSNIAKGNQSVLDVLTGQTTQKQTVTPKTQKKDSFDTGTDPFADMISDNVEKKEEKVQNEDDNDPFADIGGSAFDDPIMSSPVVPKTTKNALKKVVTQPIETKPKPQMNALKKVNSDNIILDMFANGAAPDPNLKKKEQKKDDSNPFGDDNPFGVSTDNVANDNNDNSNPFDALGDPFGSTEDVKAESNPFEALDDPFASNDNLKSEEFMADRDPFAGM